MGSARFNHLYSDSGIGRGPLIFIGLIIITGIFAGPELYSFFTKKIDKSVAEQKVEVLPEEEIDQSGSPMARLLQRVEKGEFVTPTEELKPINPDPEPEVPQERPVQAASWEMLKNEAYGEILKSSLERTIAIYTKVSPDFVRTRQALLNYANGIDFVLRAPQDLTPAAEALSYLETLQLHTTRAFEDDGVEGGLYNGWREIALDTSRATDNLKRGITNSFRLKIDGAKATFPKVASFGKAKKEGKKNKSKGKKSKGKGKSVQPPKPPIDMVLLDAVHRKGTRAVSVSGLVKGDGLNRIEVYRNGVFLEDATVDAKVDGAVPFHFRAEEGTGVFAVRAVTHNGQFLEKRFQFLEELTG